MSTASPDTEVTLLYKDLRLRVSPYGASLRGLWHEREQGRIDLITGYTGAAGKVGGQGDVLIPFPGRVRAGKYSFEGQPHEMPINDKDGPNAIHGFLRSQVWDVAEQTESSIRFTTQLDPAAHPGYPFALKADVAYTLGAKGLAVRFAVKNIGTGNAPVGAGFHPYFTVGSQTIDNDILHIPMAATLDFVDLLPTGKFHPVDDTPFDFRAPRAIGDVQFNTCYLGPARDFDGLLRIRLSAADGAHGLTIWLDKAFDYVVFYSGDPLPESHRRRSLAIEPMTCGSDAFNHREFGLTVLKPGLTLTGAWGVSDFGAYTSAEAAS